MYVNKVGMSGHIFEFENGREISDSSHAFIWPRAHFLIEQKIFNIKTVIFCYVFMVIYKLTLLEVPIV
jgi:hypothetical protein